MSPAHVSKKSHRQKPLPFKVEPLEDRLVMTGVPYLIDDVNPTPGHTDPKNIVDFNGLAFFSRENAAGIYVSNGTESGTYPFTWTSGGFPSYSMTFAQNQVVIGNEMYFSARRSQSLSHTGNELWVTDGTSAGTRLIKDIDPFVSGSPIQTGAGSNPAGFTKVGDYVYFSANVSQATGTGRELWRTDGTSAGTILVADIVTGTGSSSPEALTAAGGRLFFTALSGGQRRLYTLDGSTATSLTNGFDVLEVTAVGNEVYFTTSNKQLWKSDGTAGGTALVQSGFGVTPTELTNIGGIVYFASDSIYRTDGTTSGTYSLGGSQCNSLENFNGTLYFSGSPAATGRELYRVNAAGTGVELVTEIQTGTTNSDVTQLTAVGSTLFFAADNGVHGLELWKTDGTVAGTVMVKNIAAASASSTPEQMTAVDGKLFFRANDGVGGRELWVSDGTEAGTHLTKEILADGSGSIGAQFIYVFGDTCYFFGTSTVGGGQDLFKTTGQQGNVELVYDLPPGATVYGTTIFNGELYFDVNGQLWKSDGTTAGTGLVSSAVSSVRGDTMVVFDGKLYFTARDSTHGYCLWVTDGTTAGTQFFFDFSPVVSGYTPVNAFYVLGDKLIFQTDDGTHGTELWVTDGTTSGTSLLQDIYVGTTSSYVSNYTLVGSTLFFTANDNVHGEALWKTDGTAAGTVLVKDLDPSTSTSQRLQSLIAYQGALYFNYNTNAVGEPRGLWKSDGTEAGTVLVKSLHTIRAPVVLGNYMYFSTSTEQGHYELWRSDGTDAGTTLVKQINPTADDEVRSLTVFGDQLLFTANDGVHGVELWISDGTEAGTYMTADSAPGAKSFGVAYIVPGTTKVFLRANEGRHGDEPWAIEPGNLDPVADAGGPYTIVEGESLTLDASASYDPEPEDTLSYSWDINGDGNFDDAFGVSPTISWDVIKAIGVRDDGTFVVRVRVSDGNGGVAYSRALVGPEEDGPPPSESDPLLTILNAAPTASAIGVASVIRGNSASFTLSALDASPIDQAAGFTFEIDWNDDGIFDETIAGPSGVSVSHVFDGVSGINHVTVRAIDKDGGVSDEFVVDINVIPYAVELNNFVWIGTTGDDIVAITYLSPSVVQVHETQLNGIVVDNVFEVTGFSGGVVARAGAGNDVVNASSSTRAVSLIGNEGSDSLFGGTGNDVIHGDGDGGEGANDFIDGGAGNDVIHGDGAEGSLEGSDTINGGDGDDAITADGAEGADDIIAGNAGNDVIDAGGGNDLVDGGADDDLLLSGDGGEGANDTLLGGDGRDILVGDSGGSKIKPGADLLDGGLGEDIVLAGAFTPGDVAFLTLIQQEWTSARSFADRVANISGTGAGPRDNGNAFLLPGVNVFSDAGAASTDAPVDEVFGGGDADWIILDAGHDNATELEPDDLVLDIGPFPSP